MMMTPPMVMAAPTTSASVTYSDLPRRRENIIVERVKKPMAMPKASPKST